jgi:hypothetical protein
MYLAVCLFATSIVLYLDFRLVQAVLKICVNFNTDYITNSHYSVYNKRSTVSLYEHYITKRFPAKFSNVKNGKQFIRTISCLTQETFCCEDYMLQETIRKGGVLLRSHCV